MTAKEFLIKKGIIDNYEIWTKNSKNILLSDLLDEFIRPPKKQGFWSGLKNGMRMQG